MANWHERISEYNHQQQIAETQGKDKKEVVISPYSELVRPYVERIHTEQLAKIAAKKQYIHDVFHIRYGNLMVPEQLGGINQEFLDGKGTISLVGNRESFEFKPPKNPYDIVNSTFWDSRYFDTNEVGYILHRKCGFNFELENSPVVEQGIAVLFGEPLVNGETHPRLRVYYPLILTENTIDVSGKYTSVKKAFEEFCNMRYGHIPSFNTEDYVDFPKDMVDFCAYSIRELYEILEIQQGLNHVADVEDINNPRHRTYWYDLQDTQISKAAVERLLVQALANHINEFTKNRDKFKEQDRESKIAKNVRNSKRSF